MLDLAGRITTNCVIHLGGKDKGMRDWKKTSDRESLVHMVEETDK